MSGDDKKMLSMGCAVERQVCSICGFDHSTDEHKVVDSTPGDGPNPFYEASQEVLTELPIEPLMARRGINNDFDVGRVKFLYATITKAPGCDSCGDAMKPVSASEWACAKDGCEQQGKPLVTGVYPIQQVADDPR